MTKKKNNIEKITTLDFGPEDEYYHMNDECYDAKIQHYTYQVILCCESLHYQIAVNHSQQF